MELKFSGGEECLQLAHEVLPQHRFQLTSATEVGCFVAGDLSEPDLVHVFFKAPQGRSALALHQEGRRPTPSACGADAVRFVGNSQALVNVSVDLVSWWTWA